MYDLLNHNKETADGDVVFYDGFLYIISRHTDGYDKKYSIDAKTIIPECQECYSLAEILMRYPNVSMVIHEDYLKGAIYKFGNRKVNGVKVWDKVGTTIGFA